MEDTFSTDQGGRIGNGFGVTQGITQKNYTKKCFSDPENHSGVVTYLEPDTLECEVKWVLGSITTNKASGCARIRAE